MPTIPPVPPSDSLARRAKLNVPSPNPERNAYARFIPREELGTVESWSPGNFGGATRKPAPARAEAAPPPAAPAPPAGPTLEQLQAGIEAAQQVGYEQGYRDGMAALEGFKKTHAEQVNAQLGRLVRNLNGEFDALHEQIATTVARVAVELARQVLRSELQTAPALVSQVAAEAVEAVLHSARHITLQVHPQDLPLVAAGAQEVLQARGARLLANTTIERGGCRVESDVGSIDARIASRWAQAAGAMGSELPWEASDTGDESLPDADEPSLPETEPGQGGAEPEAAEDGFA